MASAKPSAILVTLTGLLLAGYSSIVIWAWSSTDTDPQAGMAIGFLMLVTLFLLGLIALYGFGVSRGRRGFVRFVFGICALPSLSLVGRGMYLLVRWFNAGG
jgi:predicted transporter